MKKSCNEEEETMLEMHTIQGEDIIEGEIHLILECLLVKFRFLLQYLSILNDFSCIGN
jgi:hypothetical protein